MLRAVAVLTGDPHSLSHFLAGSLVPIISWLSSQISSSHYVPGLQPGHRTDKLTQEGLFVGASLLHVGTWPDSTAAVVQLVHNSTTQKEDKRKDSGHTHTF